MKRLISTLAAAILAAAAAAAASYRYAVIPVEFSDVSFTDQEACVSGKVLTAQEYFNSQFSPTRTFVFDILPVVKLPYPVSRYGTNTSSLKDAGLDEALRVACIQSRADFSVYDNDGDGIIENICIIMAGKSEADGGGAECIWPQHLYLSDRGGTLNLGKKTADSFSICTEFSTDGTFCHEFAHSLGLQDLYDTDGKLSGGTSKGLWGTLSIMAGTDQLSNFCAIELEQLGLGTPLTLSEGSYTLKPLSRSKEYLRIDSDNPGEYFLLECRDNNGYDSGIGGSGLVIYHIDRSLADGWYSDTYRRNLSAMERWSLNQVNCRPEHQCARVVEAVPGTDEVSEIFFPQQGRTSFGSETDPPFRFWSGATSSLALNDITSEADGSISFSLITPLTVTCTDIFQDAAIVNWTVAGGLQVRECRISWHASDGSTASGGEQYVIPYSEGTYSATLSSLSPQTDYQATVRVICTSGAIYSRSLEFRTKMQADGTLPYIWLSSLERGDDGSFKAGGRLPLRIYNPVGAQSVRWYFNGLRIYPSMDGWWTLQSSGLLKAEIWHADGTKDIITKQITVR